MGNKAFYVKLQLIQKQLKKRKIKNNRYLILLENINCKKSRAQRYLKIRGLNLSNYLEPKKNNNFWN